VVNAAPSIKPQIYEVFSIYPLTTVQDFSDGGRAMAILASRREAILVIHAV